uniref:Putative secreted protein n=1 Tax=Anopheles darlingi TaxID=43151 RepID=A0A2M4D8I5_ANODA
MLLLLLAWFDCSGATAHTHTHTHTYTHRNTHTFFWTSPSLTDDSGAAHSCKDTSRIAISCAAPMDHP